MAKRLKEAKLAIKEKDFATAEAACNDIIRADPKHYNAHVFLAVVYSKTERPASAEKSYRTAIGLDATQVLGWQGLTTLYEKAGADDGPLADSEQKLLECYSELERFHGGDPIRSAEVRHKKRQLHEKLEMYSEALPLLIAEIEHAESSHKLDLLRELPSLCKKAETASVKAQLQVNFLRGESPIRIGTARRKYVEQNILQFDVVTAMLIQLAELVEDVIEIDKVHGCIIQRTMLRRDATGTGLDQCVAVCRAALVASSECLIAMESLLELALQEHDLVPVDEVIRVAQKLRGVSPESVIAVATVGASLAGSIVASEVEEGQNLLESAIAVDKTCLVALLGLAVLCGRSRDDQKCLEFVAAVKSSVKTLEALHGHPFWNKIIFDVLMLEGAARARIPGMLSQAAVAFGNASALYPRTGPPFAGLAEVALAESKLDQAEGWCKKALGVDGGCAAAISAQSWVYFFRGEFVRAEELARLALQSDSSQAKFRYRLGRILWESDGTLRTSSVKEFISAVQLDPRHSAAFLYLGHFYMAQSVSELSETKRSASEARGIKCYEKSLLLDPHQIEAGEVLTKRYLGRAELDDVVRVCTAVTSVVKGGMMRLVVWAWKLLARIEQRRGRFDEAVLHGQSAVRADASDSQCWFVLGEAYSARGSFLASLKALQRSLELEQNQPHCKFLVGRVYQTLGQFNEAINEYNECLAMSPRFLPATYSAARTWFSIARESVIDGMLGPAVNAIQHALDRIGQALDISPSFVCTWKLAGDSCQLAQHIPILSLRDIRLPAQLGVDSTEKDSLPGQHVLQAATAAYTHAVRLRSDSATWLDLAISCFGRLQARCDDRDFLCSTAFAAAKKSVSLDSGSAASWNALGAIAIECKRPDIAQHACIKALELGANNALSWINLGALYLKHHDFELANKVFSMAQAIEPSLSRPWIGQAMLSQLFPSEDAASSNRETLDLFRHAFELATHPQACLGFGCNVARFVTSSSSPNAIIPSGFERQYVEQAIVALQMYTRTRFGSGDANAQNCLGALLSSVDLHEGAVTCFRGALQYLPEGKNRVLVLSNLAHSLAAIGDFSSAIRTRQEVGDHGFTTAYEIGWCLLHSGKLVLAANHFRKAVEFASESGDTQALLLGLAGGCAASVAQGNMGSAENLLERTNNAHILPRVIALSLLVGELSKAEMGLGRLAEITSENEALTELTSHYGLLQTVVQWMSGLHGEAKTTLVNAWKKNPENPILSDALAALMAQPNQPPLDKSEEQSSCEFSFQTAPARTAVALQREITGTYSSMVQHTPEARLALALVTCGSCVEDYAVAAVSVASAAVHTNPSDPYTWAVLSAALYSKALRTGNPAVMDASTIGADTCIQLVSDMPSSMSFLKRSTQSIRATVLCHWAEVQACWTRLAAALLEPELAHARLRAAASICRTCAQKYDGDQKRKGYFILVYGMCEILSQTASGFTTLASGLELIGDPSPETWQVVGELLERSRLPNEAVLCYGQADPTRTSGAAVGILLRSALCNLHFGNTDEGIEMASQAIRLDGKGTPTSYAVLGLGKREAGDYKSAKKAFAKAEISVERATSLLIT